MSQEKVARYKEEKANRKEIMKKERRRHFFRKSVVGILSIAVIGWIGYSAYDTFAEKKPRQSAEVDYSEIQTYLQGLTEETAE